MSQDTPSTSTAAAIFARLAAPFSPEEVRTREEKGKGATRRYRYITPRTARRRLNEVLGPDGWENRVRAAPQGVVCSITIHLPDGRTLTREAVGGYPEMPKAEDGVKGGDSDAFKRAAALFGVGEYLYGEKVYTEPERPADPPQRPREPARPAAGTNGHGRAETHVVGGWGPDPASPAAGPAAATAPAPASDPKDPRTGKALFGWLKDREDQGNRGLVRHLNDWARPQGFPGRMVDWDRGQVARGLAEALRKLASIDSQEVPGE
jgi:hypothetical protein